MSHYYIPVKFHPTAVGPIELSFFYSNTAGDTAQTDLKGFGIVPKISTSDVDFGTMLAKDYPNAHKKTITFTNVKYQDQDSLTITDFASSKLFDGTNADINQNFNNPFGKEGFAYDHSAILDPNNNPVQLPITIQPGESITLNAEFVAPSSGPWVANLTSVSDADADATSKLTGNGLIQGISVGGSAATTCVNGSTIVIDTIRNSGTAPINITSSVIIDPNNYFTFVNTTDAGPMTLGPDSTVYIQIMFNPGANPGTYKATIQTNNSTANDSAIQATVSATAVDFTRTTSTTVNPAVVNIVDNAGNSSNVNYTISMLNPSNDDAALANATTFEVVVTYPINYLGVDISNSANYSSDLTAAGWNIAAAQNADNTAKLVTLTFNFSNSKNQYLNKAVANLLTVKFATYLPNSLAADNSIPPSTIAHTVLLPNNKCLTVSGNSGVCTVNPVCAIPLRLVNISSNSYYLDEISPNPVSSDGANLKFGLANDGTTEIKIINTNGEVVATPVSGFMKQGNWQISLPVTDLASGVYNVTLTSYPFTESKKLVVVK
jgi:hypothetical protein